MIVYKIVAFENGKYKWLFHGNFGTREIKFNERIECQIRHDAIDGTNGTPYTTGFHTLPSLEDAISYMDNFKNKDRLRIVECEIECKETWMKDHAKVPVYLSSSIVVIKEVDFWE